MKRLSLWSGLWKSESPIKYTRWICVYLHICRNIKGVFIRSLSVLCWVVMTSKWHELFCAFILWFNKTLWIWVLCVRGGGTQRNRKCLRPKKQTGCLQDRNIWQKKGKKKTPCVLGWILSLLLKLQVEILVLSGTFWYT